MAAINIVDGNEFLPDEKLRQWLASWIVENPKHNTAVLSRSDHIGVSRTRLDAYLDGTYLVPKSKGGKYVEDPSKSDIEDKIRSYKDRVVGTERHGYTNHFVETKSWGLFKYTANMAINEKVIVLIYGNPGVGKSRCLQKYKTSKLTTMPIAVSCSANVTTPFFVRSLARELKLGTSKSTADLEYMIVEKLRKNSRPIFVDQANYLNDKAFGSACYIWEEARVPIVLIGTQDLYDSFTESRLTQDVRVQLNSRVAWHCKLPSLSLAEVKTICDHALGEYATSEAVQEIYNTTTGNHRHLEMMIPRIRTSADAYRDELRNGTASIGDIIKKASDRIIIDK